MNEIIEKSSVSLPVRLNISAPSWTKQFKDQKSYNCYSREGMTDLKIARTFDKIKISEERHNEAKAALDHFLKLSSVPVSMGVFREVFKLVNGAISNSLSREIFNFRIKALYSIFADYPACIFTQEIARKIAKLNIFFPSAKEIESVLDEAKEDLESEISNLQSIVGNDFYTKEDQLREQMELQAKRRERQEQKEEDERRHRINRLNAITKPLDDLNKVIQEAMENYIPANPMEMNSQELIKVFTEQMNQINDPQIKSILQDKINTIRSAARQIEELRKLGVVLKDKKKQGVFA
ncbi:unnamed protein product [Commensalibacter communis]|uniref:hypothetical protein n=1 Tax=Commensalibacter communis TaxID=2972786 RepID=UPI0022FF95BA|nr:hypothetical protein [Commensalibacter communis]CAI3953888.1 unnamed protein product [Commensalibacter communis]CAI3958950.1 unnamed protein product [Commensalibacter communis]